MALRSLGYCRNDVERMLTSAALADYEEHWKNFLVHIVAVRNKVNDMGANGTLPQSTVSKVGAFFSSPFGKYLIHARNCDNHTIKPITAISGSSVTISGKKGGGTIYRGSVSGGSSNHSLVTDGNIEVVFNPSKVTLIDVVDKNQTFIVPTTKPDGSPVENTTPHLMAQLALECLDKILKV